MIHSELVPDENAPGPVALESVDPHALAERRAGLGPISRLRWLLDAMLLAVCYFMAGYIGLSLAVPPGYATLVWPASGVALAALLLRGPRMWIGVWMGSAAINMLQGLEGVGTVSEAVIPLAIVATVGIGAALQAVPLSPPA